MKKTIIGIIIGLLLGLGIVGGYLYFSNPKEEVKNNNEEKKEEIKKDEYYQIYFEDRKIYYSLNKGEKKYLMDNINNDKNTDNYLYDDDKLYYYTMDTTYNGDNVTGYKYNFSYIDLNTKKKNENFANLEVDVKKQIHIRKINDNKVYYAYGKVEQLNSEAKVGVDEYSFETKETKNILEKTITGKVSGGGYIPPIVEVDENRIFIQAMDGKTENIYKVENGKEGIIVDDVRSSNFRKTFNILNDKLYYIDNNLLFSYNIKDGSVTKESATLTNYFGNVLIFSDMIAYVDESKGLHIKTKDSEKIISLKFDSSICTECNNLYISSRIDDNKLQISSYYAFSAFLELNNAIDIPESEGGGSILNVVKMQTADDGEDSIYNNRYFEYRR